MIRIGGFAPVSFADWPGEISAVIFCQGCPWDCGYCHNPDLIPARAPSRYGWDQILGFLRQRRGLLDGVVFSGGEPLLQKHLPAAMAAVKELGFRLGLHTGGAYPARFGRVLPLLDWVGFDIKAAPQDYPDLTHSRRSGDDAMESFRLLRRSGVPFETRTTLDPYFFTPPRLFRLEQTIRALGLNDHRMQDYRETGTRPRAG
nr:anaerobic ribonucleoside-triphosphate reductase activating protein [Pseudomonas sp. GX19020]